MEEHLKTYDDYLTGLRKIMYYHKMKAQLKSINNQIDELKGEVEQQPKPVRFRNPRQEMIYMSNKIGFDALVKQKSRLETKIKNLEVELEKDIINCKNVKEEKLSKWKRFKKWLYNVADTIGIAGSFGGLSKKRYNQHLKQMNG